MKITDDWCSQDHGWKEESIAELSKDIDAAIAAAVRQEREECVRLCRELWEEGHLFSEASRMMSAIRNKETPDAKA